MPNQGPVAWTPAEVQEWLREDVIEQFKENAVSGAGECAVDGWWRREQRQRQRRVPWGRPQLHCACNAVAPALPCDAELIGLSDEDLIQELHCKPLQARKIRGALAKLGIAGPLQRRRWRPPRQPPRQGWRQGPPRLPPAHHRAPQLQ